MGFAVWIGRMGAALAAVLAVVWLIEAQPDPTGRATLAARAECRHALGTVGRTALEAQMLNTAEMALRYQRGCDAIGTQWNQDLVTRGALAGVAAILLLLVSAMAAHIAGPAPRPKIGPSPQEFAEMIAQERDFQLRLTGKPISQATARETVERRLHSQGQYPDHG